jgi:hypothetical protein
MNNPIDNGSEYNLDSIFDHLIQSLEIDPHQHPIPEQTHHNIMSVPDFNGYDPHHLDISNCCWALAPSGFVVRFKPSRRMG